MKRFVCVTRKATAFPIAVSLLLAGCAAQDPIGDRYQPEKLAEQHLFNGDTRYVNSDALPACPVAANEIYIVMPEEGGKVGTVDVVLANGKRTVLHGDYSAMKLEGEQSTAFLADQAQLDRLFGKSIAMLPSRALASALYFELGNTRLTEASQKIARNIYQKIRANGATEVVLIGHTDTIDTAENNLALSIQRAKVVEANLISIGVPAKMIKIQGLGEEAPLVPTPDNRSEPRNRCVEILVR